MQAIATNQPDTSQHALDNVARQSILARLAEARAMAENGLHEHFDAFQTMLREIEDTSGAWRAAREQGFVQTTSRLACAALARSGGEPVDAFLLIPFGEVEVERPVAGESFEFTRSHAEQTIEWFEQLDRKLAIDYEHQSFGRFNTRSDGLSPAAGWIGGLETRDDGLWAIDVTWTDRAADLLHNGEYRYFSPVIFWTNQDRSQIAGLGPVALTNDPAMRGVQALAASRIAADTDDEAPDEPVESDQQALDAAQAQVALLRKQLCAQEADMFIERGMRTGKILDSTSLDWREDYLHDADRTEARLRRAPILLPPGRVVSAKSRGAAETKSAVRQDGIDAEDMAAYEQALASGRVRRFGTEV